MLSTAGRHCGWFLVALLLVLLGAIPGIADEPEEYRVKGAFLYNFLKYVEWPEEHYPTDSETFVIVVYGEDPFGPSLDEALSGRSVDAHQVTVRRVAAGDSIPACHLLFTTLENEDQLRPLLVQAHSLGVLTVGEAECFLRTGGVIRFLLDDNRIRFDVNLQNADSADLAISSKLLHLARMVVRRG
jgi:hypothetical protein